MTYDFKGEAALAYLKASGSESGELPEDFIERALRACAKATAEECARMADPILREIGALPASSIDAALGRYQFAIRALAERIEKGAP
jgi:hypothetical protein